ncbi:MAG: alpha-glucosidase C-terminal domain-containing protein, partial [Chloroflexota bacterium]
ASNIQYYSPDPKQRINLGIRRRLAPLMGNDQRKIELMHSMLFTLPGAPVLYYGDEIGMGDNIGLFDRNGVRTPMQWNTEINGGFSEANIERLYAPPISDPEYGYNQVNVEAQMADESSLLHSVRRMIRTFKPLSMLTEGTLTWLGDTDNRLLCFWREDAEGKLLAIHNLSDQEVAMTLPTDTKMYRDVVHPDYDPMNGELTIPPYGYYWLVPDA